MKPRPFALNLFDDPVPAPIVDPELATKITQLANAKHFPKVLQLVLEKHVKLYLDGCKVVQAQSGKIYLVSLVFGAGFYGTFRNNGAFMPTSACTRNMLEQLADVELRGLDAVKEIAQLTGRCCVCGRTLTNESSIEDGIGPVCSEKMGEW